MNSVLNCIILSQGLHGDFGSATLICEELYYNILNKDLNDIDDNIILDFGIEHINEVEKFTEERLFEVMADIKKDFAFTLTDFQETHDLVVRLTNSGHHLQCAKTFASIKDLANYIRINHIEVLQSVS